MLPAAIAAAGVVLVVSGGDAARGAGVVLIGVAALAVLATALRRFGLGERDRVRGEAWRRGPGSSGVRVVADAMTEPPVLLTPDTTLQAASATMLDAHAHSAIVVERGRVCGLVTVAHVAQSLAAGPDTRVGAVAELDPPVVRAQEPLAEAHERMRAAQRAALPVVAEGGEPVGLLVDLGSDPAP